MPDGMGFRPVTPFRKPIRSEVGVKLGYLTYQDGKQHFTDLEGRIVARNVRFKKEYVQSRMSATGGSFVPPSDWR